VTELITEEEIEAKIGELSTSVLPILQYLPRRIGDHTNHGHDHSEEVERLLRTIVRRCNLHGGGCNIQPIEQYLLFCAAWLHDIGNILGREGHGRNSCRIIDSLSPKKIHGLMDDCVEMVKWICYTHSGANLEMVPLNMSFRGEPLKIRYLAAVFRVADAADMGSRRAPSIVYGLIADKLNEKSRRIWRSHNAVKDVTFMPVGSSIIITVTSRGAASQAIREFVNDFESARGVLEEHEFPYTAIDIREEPRVPVP
jgi:HD superfamily phosphodiesterase